MVESQRSVVRKVLWYLGWPARELLLLALKIYKKWISPGLPNSCKYHPSCSTYAVRSVERHGVGKGSLLAAWRVLKCNPFSEGGLNPIPSPGHWRSDVHTNGDPRVSEDSFRGDLELEDSGADPGLTCSTTTSKTDSTNFLAPGV